MASLPAQAEQFLQRVKRGLPVRKRALPEAAPPCERDGKCVLIVDDARKLFALTGLLENCGMRVVAVETGQEAIRQLHENGAIDIVLMDIMMPDMDGYETMRRIRSEARFARLPIMREGKGIGLTIGAAHD